MALVIGNKQIQSIIPQYDDAGTLVSILVRANRAIIDNTTAKVRHGLPTSTGIDILPQLTPAQKAGATAFLARLTALISTMPEFEE